MLRTLLLAIAVSSPLLAESLTARASALASAGKHAEALAAFEKAWAAGAREGAPLYDAACSAALLGRRDAAFLWLGRAIDGGVDNFEHAQGDPDLASLRPDPRFAAALARMKAAKARADAAIGDPKLRDELLARMAADQKARQALIADGFKSEPLKLEVMETDQKNGAFLREAIAAGSWPGKKRVGKDGEVAAFLLVQHADLDPGLQKLALPLLEKAVREGDATPRFLAYLTDRVLIGEHKPQRYGTQLMKGPAGEELPQPIEDAEHVDQRRAALGLGPLADYLREVREAARAGVVPRN